MEIIKFSLDETKAFNEQISACIGYFDGLHKGHQALVKKAQEEAKKRGIKSGIITFFPDPKDVITGKKHKHIQSFEHRLKIFEAYGIDVCIVFDFTLDMCTLSKEDFFNRVLLKLDLACLVCGFDFHYAYKGSGDYHSLIEASKGLFEVNVIDSVNYESEKISSTRVRAAIENGQMELANQLLGYTYHLIGKVVHGKCIGHKLGFPTANLEVDDETIYPSNGVYIGYIKSRGRIFKAMINVGCNPTISDHNLTTIEAHIIDFNDDIYGEELIIYFISKIRDVIKFSSKEELARQLESDTLKARGQSDEINLLL